MEKEDRRREKIEDDERVRNKEKEEERRRKIEDDERKKQEKEEERRRKIEDEERKKQEKEEERRRKIRDDERKKQEKEEERRRKTEEAERKKQEKEEERRRKIEDDERKKQEKEEERRRKTEEAERRKKNEENKRLRAIENRERKNRIAEEKKQKKERARNAELNLKMKKINVTRKANENKERRKKKKFMNLKALENKKRLENEAMKEKEAKKRSENEAMKEKEAKKRIENEANREQEAKKRLEIEAIREKEAKKRSEIEAIREKEKREKIAKAIEKGQVIKAKRAEPKPNNNFNASATLEQLEVNNRKTSFTNKIKRVVKTPVWKQGWLTTVKSAKNVETLKNLETTFDRKVKLRDQIANTDEKKFKLTQKKVLASVVMNPINNIDESEKIFMKRLAASDLKEYIKGRPISNQNKKLYMDQADKSNANLNTIRESVDKQVNLTKKRKTLNSFVNASDRVQKKQKDQCIEEEEGPELIRERQ
jgi:hypothetical protein